MWAAFLEAVEFSQLGYAARSTVWLYPLANLSHVAGVGLLVGSILVFDLLLLRRRYEDAARISRTALGVAASGLTLLAISGPVMFTAEATAFGRNPIFIAKMLLVAAGLANLAAYHWAERRMAGPMRIPQRARLHAGISAGVWICVALAGRAIAYV